MIHFAVGSPGGGIGRRASLRCLCLIEDVLVRIQSRALTAAPLAADARLATRRGTQGAGFMPAHSRVEYQVQVAKTHGQGTDRAGGGQYVSHTPSAPAMCDPGSSSATLGAD